MEYEIIRSKRKTLSLEIRNGSVLVRSPWWVSNHEISAFVDKNTGWIQGKLAACQKQSETAAKNGILTEADLKELKQKAKEIIPQRVEYYAQKLGVNYGPVSIRAQHTKWGSCSSKGNLSFNCLLLLTPPEVVDSVVIHELCHRKEMNHSERFYSEVLKIYPEYKIWNRWLRENGSSIMSRLPPK